MSLATLRAMAAGGIYDQVGGGFARYAVDATWTVPHFEKMLYDNALLARAYLHGWQVSDEPLLRRVCCGDAGLGPAGDARPRGRLLLRAGRRLRGRRGQVLRVALDELREALGDEALLGERGGVLRRDRERQLRGRERARGRAGPSPRALREHPARACWRARASARGRDSTTSA